jgi:NCS2 family nucleobase:cation symporter-2/xanthine permease XanP
VLTPAVGGTVLMLMALSVAPVVWGMLKKVPPEFASTGVPPLLLLSTLVPIVAISLFAGPLLQLWAPLIGVVIGLPGTGWPGLSLDLGPAFWALLPAFVLITMVGCIETYADGLAVQRTSHRTPRPIDFRLVQGAINADGLGFKRLGWDTPAENRLMLAAGESLPLPARQPGARGRRPHARATPRTPATGRERVDSSG